MGAIRGVLFDKDGTLVDYAATWLPANLTAARQAAGGDEALATRLLAMAGYEPQSNRVTPGSALAAGTARDIARLWAPHLPGRDAASLAVELDAVFAGPGVEGAVPTTDLPALFERLKSRGLALGVATSDSAAALTATVERFGLGGYVDFLAGYDSGHGVKPEAGMARAFCRVCGLEPVESAVVGDNTHDLEMGRAAGFGLVIGVLTGTGTREVLSPLADRILDSIAELEDAL